MRQESISKSEKRQRNTVRPRTKLALLITISVFVLSGGIGCKFQTVRSCFVGSSSDIDADREGHGRGHVSILPCTVGSYLLQILSLPYLSGLPSFFVTAVCGFLMRFVPGIMMGYITVKTTTVSEFVAAMKKLHLPEQIIIQCLLYSAFSQQLLRNIMR